MAESDSDERLRLTPEQRRFLGQARSVHSQSPAEAEPAKPAPPPAKTKTAPPPPVSQPVERASRRSRKKLKLSRVFEMQNLALFLGGIILLGGTFYVGKKFEYWRYRLTNRNEAKIAAQATGEFAGASAEELVEHAMMAERLGQWDEAAKRLIAAKYKNIALGGVLFHAAKLYYDHSQFDAADRLFESAIGFGEDVAASNYYRAMIASSRNDFAAAERFFEAAANAAPFNADYYYSLAETLRKDHRPKDAIARYEQAARRGGETEQTVCQFKARMAAIEAADVDPVRIELEQKRQLGPLPIDWMLTEAALAIHQGDTSEAVKLIEQAREADRPQLDARFAACVSDRFFSVASQNNAELTKACQVTR
jgi:tetratricopeptide (TPR) repeat protein